MGIDLDSAAHFAGLLYTDEELALICDVPIGELRLQLKEGQTEFARTVLKARFTRISRLREVELAMAEQGSSPALSAARAMVERMQKA